MSPDNILVSPGDIHPPKVFRDTIKNTTYRLPLYPSSMLLATEIELSVHVPYVFHTLPTLIKLSYDPHVSGGFGPFSFGPLYRASAGNMLKFRVGVNEGKITLMIPGTQLIGYVCDVVPKHPREPILREPLFFEGRKRRSVDGIQNDLSTDSDFDQWLYSKKRRYPPLQDGLFHKDSNTPNTPRHRPSRKLPLHRDGLKAEDTTETLAMLITPTAPLNSMFTDSKLSFVYYNSTL